MKVVKELEYAVLYDHGYYWVIEDKIFRNFPLKRQASTKTAIEMVFDFVELLDGSEVIARAYIPKENIELKVVIADLERWNKRWLKKKAELEALKALLNTQQQEEKRESEENNWEKVLKRYF